MLEALQTAIFSALNGVISAPVFDRVPQETEPTFVKIGSGSSTRRETKTRAGSSHLIECDVYTTLRAYQGRKLAKSIMDEIYDTLHQQVISVAGFQSQMLRFEFSTTFEEPDGTRGVIRFSTHTAQE